MSIDLIKIKKEDIETLRIWRNSKTVSDNMLNQNFISKDQQIKWFNKINTDENGSYWLIKLKNGTKIGFASLSNIKYSEYIAEPALYIGNPKFINSLYGIEAYFFLLNYGFSKLNLLIIDGVVLSHNIAALKMNKLFGFNVYNLDTNESISKLKIKLIKKDFYNSKMSIFFNKQLK